jgi:hypothetical protein
MRKTDLARLLAQRPDGIFVAPFEAGEIGPDLFLFVIHGYSGGSTDRPDLQRLLDDIRVADMNQFTHTAPFDS